MYAKIIEDRLVIAPKKFPTVINGEPYKVYNPPAELLVADGWLPVVFVDPGEPVEGYHYEDHYEEQDNQIIQVWELVSNDEMEISAEEALAIILGGSE